MTLKKLLRSLVPHDFRRRRLDVLAARSLRHVTGVQHLRLAPDEVAITCLVKNGEYYIREFIEHHLELGCRHVFIIDNQSTDGTREIASRFNEVSIYTTSLNVGTYQTAIKRQAAKRCVKSGWCLDLDIDEFFDFPFASELGISGLLKYCNDNGYTAVAAQMLDMYSGRPLASLESTDFEPIRSSYTLYDTNDIREQAYRDSELTARFAKKNVLSDSSLKLLFGGIRRRLYDLDCLLTKHPLFAMNVGVELFTHVHFLNNAHVADVSGILRHYKLTNNAHITAKQNAAVFQQTSEGYRRFLDALGKNADTSLATPASRVYSSCEGLRGTIFYRASDSFTGYVDSYRTQQYASDPLGADSQ